MRGEMKAKTLAELPLLPLGEATAQDTKAGVARLQQALPDLWISGE